MISTLSSTGSIRVLGVFLGTIPKVSPTGMELTFPALLKRLVWLHRKEELLSQVTYWLILSPLAGYLLLLSAWYLLLSAMEKKTQGDYNQVPHL